MNSSTVIHSQTNNNKRKKILSFAYLKIKIFLVVNPHQNQKNNDEKQ